MSDGSNADGIAAGDEKIVPAAPSQGVEPPAPGGSSPAPAGAQDNSLAGLGEDTGGTITAPGDWPVDWRERFTAGDEAQLRAAKRFGSPEGVWKKLLNQEKLLSDRAQHRGPVLPDNPTEEQIAEHRKQLGVPDTVEGYGVKLDESLRLNDADKEMLQGVLSYAHEAHVPASYAKAMVDGWQREAARIQQTMDAEAQRTTFQVETALRKQYGADFEINKTLVKEFFDGRPGLARLAALVPLDLEASRDVISMVRERAPLDRLLGSDESRGGKSLDDQWAELRDKSLAGTLTKTERDTYHKVTEARMKRDDRESGKAA